MSEEKKEPTAEEIDLTKAQNDRCIPFAKELIKMIGEYEPLIGKVEQGEINQHYKDLIQSIKAKMLEKGELRLDDINYILRLALQHYDSIKYIMSENINRSLHDLQIKQFGKELGEMTYNELDEYLK
jgi:hypothetical protein